MEYTYTFVVGVGTLFQRSRVAVRASLVDLVFLKGRVLKPVSTVRVELVLDESVAAGDTDVWPTGCQGADPGDGALRDVAELATEELVVVLGVSGLCVIGPDWVGVVVRFDDA